MRKAYVSSALVLPVPVAMFAAAAKVVPSGSDIKLRTDENIKATPSNAGHTYSASVAEDVTDANGKVIIPKGSRATLDGDQRLDPNQVELALKSLTVNGHKYTPVASNAVAHSGGGKEGVGKNNAPRSMLEAAHSPEL